MTEKPILSDEEIASVLGDFGLVGAGRDLIKAVLQSAELQQLRADAERYSKIARHCFHIKVTHDRTSESKVQRLVLDVRKTTVSASGWVDENVDALDTVMEQSDE